MEVVRITTVAALPVLALVLLMVLVMMSGPGGVVTVAVAVAAGVARHTLQHDGCVDIAVVIDAIPAVVSDDAVEVPIATASAPAAASSRGGGAGPELCSPATTSSHAVAVAAIHAAVAV